MSDEPASRVEHTAMVVYRSTGLGLWGAVLRFLGMPLEKIALFANSSQVPRSCRLGMLDAPRCAAMCVGMPCGHLRYREAGNCGKLHSSPSAMATSRRSALLAGRRWLRGSCRR